MKNLSRRQFISRSAGITGALSLLGCTVFKRQRPNIIFLLTDDQRFDALGCAGNPIIHTPNMDRLAKDGVRFTKAFVTTPICAASRASLFTGLYERTHGYTFTKPPLAEEWTDMAYPALLRKAGYQTGFIGKFGIKVQPGVTDSWFDFFKVHGHPYFKESAGRPVHGTDIIFTDAIHFLEGMDRSRPFCLSISTNAPHADDGARQQYFWPASCNDLYNDLEIPPPVLSDPAFFDNLPEFFKKSMNRRRWYWRFDNREKYQSMVKGYYRMISGIDMALGRLLKELDRLGVSDNTVIILASDNGYFLGERGFAGKWTMHDCSIRIPLILYDPRQKTRMRGAEIDELVLNIDITPTLLDLAGVVVPDHYEGRSLLPSITGRSIDSRKEVFTEHLWDHPEIPRTEAIRTERWKYIRYFDHPEYEELYNLDNDPVESINLACETKHADILEAMRSALDRVRPQG